MTCILNRRRQCLLLLSMGFLISALLRWRLEEPHLQFNAARSSTELSSEADCLFQRKNVSTSDKKCVCREGWFGNTCSIPETIWTSPEFQEWYSRGQIKRRPTPRLVINSLIVNHEMDLLEIRVKELNDVVDYFLVCEANYTFYGTSKPLHLKSNLSAGFLSEYQHKIVVVTATENHIVEGDAWAPENYFRNFLWQEGQHRLNGLRDDDLFMINDADEIPHRDVLLFLKHHDGFGEPIQFSLRWFLYGFFWENTRPVNVAGVCTVGFLRQGYKGSSLNLRHQGPVDVDSLNETGTIASPWTITGTAPRYAGWHCSWCFDIPGIRVKLASSQRDDGTRWGDNAAKYNETYIKWLRKTGKFFDDGDSLVPANGEMAAPGFLKHDSKRWNYLLHV